MSNVQSEDDEPAVRRKPGLSEEQERSWWMVSKPLRGCSEHFAPCWC